ncbi:MAG: DUF115 domain-containing protein [Verrucomicrobia bacterium]|nr:DUF115 domain-containing protein [Verrucomicrobiota bacterium]
MNNSLLHRGLRKASRIALSPIRGAGVPLGGNDARIHDLKDRHAGKRAFIIGNGPSLRVEDLHRLQGEITFACNKIYLAFDKTPWRPTYYSVVDELVAINNRDAIAKLPLTKILSTCVGKYFEESEADMWVWELSVPSYHETATGVDSGIEHPFSENLLVGFYGGGTVSYQLLQMAFYMGITEVIIIGVDFSFQVPTQTTTTEVKDRSYRTALKSEGEVNHFHPDYRKPGEAWSVPNMAAQLRAYRAALKHYQAAGRRIVNASRQTKLDVFPLEDFDRIVAR